MHTAHTPTGTPDAATLLGYATEFTVPRPTGYNPAVHRYPHVTITRTERFTQEDGSPLYLVKLGENWFGPDGRLRDRRDTSRDGYLPLDQAFTLAQTIVRDLP